MRPLPARTRWVTLAIAAVYCVTPAFSSAESPLPTSLSVERPAWAAWQAPASEPGAALPGDEGWIGGFGNPEFTPGISGEVTCSAVLGGAMVIAGSLGETCGEPAEFIARWDGSGWTPIAAGLESPPACLVEFDGHLVAGGTFTHAGGEAAGYVAEWDGSIWRSLGSGLAGGAGGGVTALLVLNGDLIAAGDFETAGGQPASRVARWDGSGWHPLGDGLGGFYGARVLALASHDGDLVAGGWFTTAGGSEALNAAAWDGESWRPLGAGLDSAVRSLTVVDGSLIAGGDFSATGGNEVNHVAVWDGESWLPLGDGLGAPGGGQNISALCEYQGGLIAGGSFTFEGQPGLSNIARWDADGRFWRTLHFGLDGPVSSLCEESDFLYAWGGFIEASGVPAHHVARWDGVAWSAICAPPAGSGIQGPVYAISQFRDDPVVGGIFFRAGAVGAENVAAWNGSSWAPLGSGRGGPVYALGVHPSFSFGEGLLVGGDFDDLNPTGWVVPNIRAWDGTNWWTMGMGVIGTPPGGFVSAVATYDDRPILAGNFNAALSASGDATSVNNIVTRDTRTLLWLEMGEGLGGQTSRVNALAVHASRLIAGGDFRTAGDISANRIAAWDGSAWSALGSGIGSASQYATVRALALVGDTLYAGGYFQQAGDALTNNVARWDGERWRPLGDGTGCDAEVLALAEVNGNLIVGGRFTHAGGIEARSIAMWDGSSWSPLGRGTNGSVHALAVVRDTLYVGGEFTQAGGYSAYNIARWTPALEVQSCAFPQLTAGQTASRSVALRNGAGRPVTLSLTSDGGGIPFHLSPSFLDSLASGITLTADQEIHTQLLFSPAAAGSYNARLRFMLNPTGRELHVVASGAAISLAMDWTSRDDYAPLFRVAAGESVRVEVTLADSAHAERVDLLYRMGGQHGYVRKAMPLIEQTGAHDRYETHVPGSVAGPRGLEFYAEAANGSVSTWIGEPGVPIRMRVVLPDLPFPTEQPAGKYRLITFPLELPNSRIQVALGDDLGSPDVTRWRMFSYDPDSARYREESNGQAFVEQVRGYWLVTKDVAQIGTGPDPASSTPADSAYILSLSPGWNLIGNPFAFPVLWDSVKVEAAAGRSPSTGVEGGERRMQVERPVAWREDEYQPDVSALAPFEGYWVHNQGEEDAVLRIPPIDASENGADRKGSAAPGKPGMDGGSGLPTMAEGEWAVRIAASVSGHRDTYNYAGVRHGGLQGADAMDRTEPPLPPGGGIALYFLINGPARTCRRLGSDVRGLSDLPEGGLRGVSDSLCFTWPFDVAKTSMTGDTRDKVALSFDWFGGLPEDASTLMIDRDLGTKIDPLAGEPYSFTLGVRPFLSDPEECRFVLLVGSRLFLEEESSGQAFRPPVTTLFAPSPNPSPGPLMIRFDLAGAGRVRLTLHDLSGAEVLRLCDGAREVGRHQITWDGRRANGHPLANGLYFLRLHAPGSDQSRKIVIVR